MPNPEFSHPGPLTALADGKRSSKAVSGWRSATGTMTYSGNFVAGNTVVVNGVTFTARASGAVGNEFNIGVDLTTSLDNLVTVLNASAVAAVAKATYVKSGSTILAITHDAEGVVGNAFTIAGSVGTASAATLAGGTDGDADDGSETLIITTLAGNLQNFYLGNGAEAQERTFFLKTKGAGANAVINGNFLGGTKLTLDTAAKWAKLKFLDGLWRPIVNTGAIS